MRRLDGITQSSLTKQLRDDNLSIWFWKHRETFQNWKCRQNQAAVWRSKFSNRIILQSWLIQAMFFLLQMDWYTFRKRKRPPAIPTRFWWRCCFVLPPWFQDTIPAREFPDVLDGTVKRESRWVNWFPTRVCKPPDCTRGVSSWCGLKCFVLPPWFQDTIPAREFPDVLECQADYFPLIPAEQYGTPGMCRLCMLIYLILKT